MTKTLSLLVSALVFSSAVLPGGIVSKAYASEGGGEPLPNADFTFKGAFGTYDKASLQRGLLVYRQVCSSCHGLKHVAFRNLTALGYTPDQVKELASEYTFQKLNDEGELVDRKGLPSDHFPNPFPNPEAASAANGGAIPPDLSLITKARVGGADYVFGVLTGFAQAPEGVHVLDGQYYNKYMAGNVIKMPPPLSAGAVEYEDGMPQTVEQYAKDVSTFLAWAAEPEMEQRKRMGFKVIFFLLAFAGLMYGVKRQIWSKVH